MARSTRSTAKTVASMDEFKALTPTQQSAMATAIAKDRDGGLSGNDLRDKYGDWLTGPRRCKILKQFGHGNVVAPSYNEYQTPNEAVKVTNGRTRTGTRHAKFHGTGPAAEARRAELTAAQKADQANLAKIGRRQNRKAKA